MRTAVSSPALLQAHHKGVLVVHVSATSCSHGVLHANDVLMEFDGNPISSDGTVSFRTGERIMFSYLISQRFVGDVVPLTVLRDGKELDLEVTLTAPGQLVPAHLSSRDPSYYVCSGLVFTVACEPYLASEYGPDFLSLAPVAILDKVCPCSYTGPTCGHARLSARLPWVWPDSTRAAFTRPVQLAVTPVS